MTNHTDKEFLEAAGMEDVAEAMTAVSVAKLVEENEHLKSRVYNLTLYLMRADEIVLRGTDRLLIERLNEYFDGMPGYCPAEFGLENPWVEEVALI